MSTLLTILIILHVLVCLLLVLIVLMQRPRNEGLGAAFGGGMTDSLFGAQTTNVLSKSTVWLGIFFFVITLCLSSLTAKMATEESPIQKSLLSMPPPEASATPAASPSPDPANPFSGSIAPFTSPVTPAPSPLLSDPSGQPSPAE